MADLSSVHHKWLGIPAKDQPPNHYRLLGVELFESDADVIDNAADQRLTHVRRFQTGANSALSQQILNQIAAARICLLTPEKKAAYDAELRQSLAPPAPPPSGSLPQPIPVAQPLLPSHPSLAQTGPPDGSNETPAALVPIAPSRGAAVRRRQRGPATTMIGVVLGGIAGLACAYVALCAISPGNDFLGIWPQGQRVVQSEPAPMTTPAPRAEPSPGTEVKPPPDAQPPTDSGAAAVDSASAPPTANPAGNTENFLPADEETEPGPSTAPPMDDPDAGIADEPLSDAEEEQEGCDTDVGEVTSPPLSPPTLAEGPERLPVPDREIRDAKRAQIRTIFSVDNARTVQEKADLADQLVKTARETRDDPPAQFALLNVAREQAVEAGRIKIAFSAIDLLAEKFEFDPDVVRVASLQESARAPIPAAEKRDIVTLGMGMIGRFVAANEFDKATALSERLLTIARPIRDGELIRSLVEQRRAAEALAANHRKAESALEALKTSPDDPDANLVAGRYLAFVKQDWEASLAHLAKSSDALLSAAAKLELAAPETPADQETLADAWWAAAEAEKEEPTQDLARALSGYWYRQAVPHLTGLAKTKAEQRIRKAAEIRPDQGPIGPAAQRQVEIVYLDDLQEVDARVAHTLGKHGAAWDGKRRTFKGVTLRHSLTTHPFPDGSPGHVTYALNRSAETFEAVAGLWDVKGQRPASDVTFRVVGDGVVLWESAPNRTLGTGQECRVDVRNIERLSLQGHCSGSAHYAVAVWVNPRITRYVDGTETGISSRDPADIQRPPR